MAGSNNVTVDLTTGVGTLSFPHLFVETKTTNEKGETQYEVQFILPKSQKEDVRALLIAIKKVGEAKWGDRWRKVRMPLRDGDKEADDLTEDGQTKGEKYPERIDCMFLNARTKKPVSVVDRTRTPITEPSEVYGGCKGKINITFYPYSNNGNTGIGVSLNGVQKISDGESFGGGRPSLDSMFDILDDEDDLGLDTDDVEEPEEKPAPKKRATAKKKAEPEDIDLDEGDDEDDLFEGLDDSDV